MAEVRPFHYAFAVADLEVARDFYVNTLGAQEARSDERWVDFNFFGHQLSAHLIVDYPQSTYPRSLVDGDHIPIPHFGVVLTKPVWEQVAERLQVLEVEFALEPKLLAWGQNRFQSCKFPNLQDLFFPRHLEIAHRSHRELKEFLS